VATNALGTTSHELADIETRCIALFIDGLILSAIGSFSYVAARAPGVGVSILIGLVYYWFFLTRNKGQTPGKALMRIRVIKTDGTPITDSDALMRYIGYFISSFFLIGWLWAFVDVNHQAWHDKIAKTFVVRAW
jgi:uncharacterized RDD family membrane protein YckC